MHLPAHAVRAQRENWRSSVRAVSSTCSLSRHTVAHSCYISRTKPNASVCLLPSRRISSRCYTTALVCWSILSETRTSLSRVRRGLGSRLSWSNAPYMNAVSASLRYRRFSLFPLRVEPCLFCISMRPPECRTYMVMAHAYTSPAPPNPFSSYWVWGPVCDGALRLWYRRRQR